MNIRSALCALALAILAPAAATAQTSGAGQDTARDVASAREVFEEVRDAVSAGKLARRDTTITCRDTGFDVEVRRYADGSGRIRRLTIAGGTEDHVDATTYFYDADGRLRFALATRGAVNGTRQEERAWYAPGGAVVRRATRVIEGPGYPFGPITPIADARRWRTAACGE